MDEEHKNEGLIGQIETRGTAKPDTLRRVARALGIDPIRIFMVAGWVEASDLQDNLQETERQFLDIFRQLGIEDRHTLRRVGEGFLRSGAGQDELRRVAEGPGSYQVAEGSQ